MKNFPLSLIAGLVCSSLLVACGGGGSSGSASTPVSTPVTAAVITSANYTNIAAQAWVSADIFHADSGTATPVGSPTINLSTPMKTLFYNAGNAAAQLPDTDRTLSDNCDNGGTITAQVHLSAPKSFGAGSRLDATSANCTINGNNLNGKLSMQVGSGPLTLALGFSNISLTSGNIVATLDGDTTLSVPASGKFTLSGNHMHVSATQSGKPLVERTFDNYSIAYDTGSTQINGSVAAKNSAGQTNSVTLKTTQAFVTDSSGYPKTGSMTASSGSGTVTLTAVGNGSVKIDFSDTSTNTNATQTLTWAQLRAM